MDVTSGQEFFAVLQKSRLLTDGQWAEAERRRAAAPEKTAAEWAKEFTAEGWLTDWQAKQLLCGRHTLFMGKYKLLDRLGGGGMGVVFTAHHAMTDRVVALKVMNKSIVSNPLAMTRFKAEVRLLCALSHPNIIAAYDADCVGNTHFLVMEYGRGQDLRVWLQNYERLPIDWVCECIRQAALGLEHAHQRGLVHRDIKPENLLVEDPQPFSKPAVKILDLGLARLMGAESPEEAALREAGQIMGTADYIAPEQIEQTELADVRSDIFSLGCTLFKLLAGRLPFDGANYAEKLVARVTQDAPPVSRFREEVPAGLNRVVAKMLARNPDERYQSPAEVAEALFPFTIEGRNAQPVPPPLPPPIASPAAPAAVSPAAVTAAAATASAATPAAGIATPVLPAEAGEDRGNGDELGAFLNQLSSSDEAPGETPHSAMETIEVQPAASSAGRAAAMSDPVAAVLERPAPAPATSRSPAAAATPREAAADPRRKNLLVGVGLGVGVSIPVVIALAFLLRPAALSLDWPLEERTESRLDIDGRRVAVPEENPAVISIRPGEHRIVIRRRGYEQLEWNLSFSRGDRIEQRVEWKQQDLSQGLRPKGSK